MSEVTLTRMATQTSARVKLQITLPEALYDGYAERAVKMGRSVEAEIIARLQRCVEFTATSPIYLDDTARNEISVVAGQLIQTVPDLLNWSKRMVQINVAGVEVKLDERLLSRLKSRCFGKSLEDTIRGYVVEGLESAVGMR